MCGIQKGVISFQGRHTVNPHKSTLALSLTAAYLSDVYKGTMFLPSLCVLYMLLQGMIYTFEVRHFVRLYMYCVKHVDQTDKAIDSDMDKTLLKYV